MVSLDAVPEERRSHVGPEAPGPMRAMAARAMMPLEPSELIRVLAYLGSIDDDRLAPAAIKTASELPANVLASALSSHAMPPSVLGFYALCAHDRAEIVEPILLNSATSDDTFAALAESVNAPNLLEIIGLNEVRALRHPAIIEKLYLNPRAPMSVVSRLVETALRNDVPLEHLPGYRELRAAVFGAEAEPADASPGISDDELTRVLDDFADRSEFRDVERQRMAPRAAEEGASDDADEVVEVAREATKTLWVRIKEMNAQQKVRLAVIGDQTARRYLVRDPRKSVAMSVLANPKITPREITLYAGQKALDEDVIRAIARHRDWTRHYSTRLALVKNPKTPSQIALNFLLGLQERDIKLLRRDKEVPGYIQRQAAVYLQNMEKKRSR